MRDRDRHKRTHAAESDPPLPEPQGDGEGGRDEAEVGARSASENASTSAPPADRDRDAAGAEGNEPAQGEMTQQLSEQRDKYLRLAAEYDNFRKRVAKERIESGSRAQAELISRLIDALDDLARFAHVDPASTDAQTLHRGIELVEQKMMKTLGAAGLEILNPVDQSFDPNLHEAVATE